MMSSHSLARDTRSDRQQRQPGLRIGTAAEMRGHLRNDDLQRRPDMRLEQMPAPCAAITFGDNGMRVHARLVARHRAIADKGDDLDLLTDVDAHVILGVEIEEAESHIVERTKPGEFGARKAVLAGEILETGKRFLAWVEHDHELPGGGRVDLLDVHLRAP